MKRTIPLLLIGFISIFAMAQNIADIEIGYTHNYKHRTGKPLSANYILLANTVSAKYYNSITEQFDSLKSTPQGQEVVSKMVMGAISRGERIPAAPSSVYVFHDIAKQTMTVYDMKNLEHFSYNEPWSEMTWEIADSTKTILNYECIMAKTNYHGREWTAWFAPEIPISLGPWKFHGLPGLILEIYEPDNLYHYMVNGIQQCNKEIIPIYSQEKYIEADRKKMLKAGRKFTENPMGRLNAELSLKVKKIRSNGSKGDKINGFNWDFHETDYH